MSLQTLLSAAWFWSSFELRGLKMNFEYSSPQQSWLIALLSQFNMGQLFFFPGIKSQISVAYQNRMCEQQVQRLEIESWGLCGSGWCHGAREARSELGQWQTEWNTLTGQKQVKVRRSCVKKQLFYRLLLFMRSLNLILLMLATVLSLYRSYGFKSWMADLI